MAFPWISPSSRDVGPRTKEPLSFPANTTPPIVIQTRGFLCPSLWAGTFDRMVEGRGEVGEGESRV